MTGVVATLVADDVADTAAEQVGNLAFTLVAPLRADDDDRWHFLRLSAGHARGR